MPFKVKNTTGSDIYITLIGLTIPAGEEISTANYRDYEIYGDTQVQTLVKGGSLVINDAAPAVVVVGTESAVTSTNWTDKAILSIPDDIFGKFWISWYSEVAAQGKNFVQVRIYNKTDSNVVAGPLSYSKTIRKAHLGDEWRPFTGFVNIDLPNSNREFALQYKTSSITDSLKIRNVYMRYTKDRFI